MRVETSNDEGEPGLPVEELEAPNDRNDGLPGASSVPVGSC